MVFCYQNCSSDWEKLLKFEAEGQEFAKSEITITIYLNRERSEQFLKQNAFLTCSWRFLRSNELEELEFKLEKNIGIYKHAGKFRKWNYPVKQQAHAKSLAVWLSTFFILVWPVWWQFGHFTVVGYLVRYMPFVVAPCKNPSKKRQIN